jgi:hypothetical protein
MDERRSTRLSTFRAFARSALAICALALAAGAPPVAAASSRVGEAAVGVYTGPADTAEHDGFSAWLGSEATYALDYIDDSQSWENIAEHSDWLLDPWAAWVRADPHRRLIISVPMLNQASSGMLAEGAAGAFDDYFRTLAQEIADHGLGNAIIRIGWEANGDWYPWRASVDPEAWKAYYRRIVTIMRSVQPKGADQPPQSFEFDLSYSRGTSGTQVRFETMYPGDDVVDILGLDSYDTKWRDSLSPPDVRWNDLLTQDMGLNDFTAFAAAHGKPMSLSEWGLWEPGHDDNGGGGDNPYFIDRTADWLADNAGSVRYHVLFNHRSDWTGDHRLASYVYAERRYRARFGQAPATLVDPSPDPSPEPAPDPAPDPPPDPSPDSPPDPSPSTPAPPDTTGGDVPQGGGVHGDAMSGGFGHAHGVGLDGSGAEDGS